MRLAFYTIDPSYCEYLRKFDKNVPYIVDKKVGRPFLGIVLNINEYRYFAPLTSPKEKHKIMKNSLDFIKINSGIWGAINLNNMIPIHINLVEKIDLNGISENKEEQDYKNLLKNQLWWCNANKDYIKRKAEKLYDLIVNCKAPRKLIDRCCDFKVNEKYCEEYSYVCGDKMYLT